MESLLLLAAPIIVSLITSGVKGIKSIDTMAKPKKKATLRFMVALLSFVSIVLGAKLSGIEVDAVSMETFSSALMVFLSSSGLYLFGKKKKVEQVNPN